MSVVTERRSGRTAFLAPIGAVEIRESGDPNTAYTVTGHAAVFNSLSLDLGGFREKIDPGAFTAALERITNAQNETAVLAVWDHDTRYILGSTSNGTLELTQDEKGLRFFLRVAPTSYAADLRILLERGDLSQCSFMFTIENESYEFVGDGEDREILIFTIHEIGELYDVTVCGRGAYPQTDVALARQSRAAVADEIRSSRVAELAAAENPDAPEGGSDGVANKGTAEARHAIRMTIERAHLHVNRARPKQ